MLETLNSKTYVVLKENLKIGFTKKMRKILRHNYF